MELTHASFFSGVGGLDLGLERAGWRTVSFSEIDPYASAVLAERWPDVPNLGDIGRIALDQQQQEPAGSIRGSSNRWTDATLWSGGFPCQDLSVAGKRAGFGLSGRERNGGGGLRGESDVAGNAGVREDSSADGDRYADLTRSGLAFAFLDLVERHRPPAILLENVPGLLSSNGGRDFGRLLGEMGQLGYGWAYRILDARHFGVPQRRRRVFIVGLHAGTGLGADSAAEVLSVGTRCDGHPATGHATGEGAADRSIAGVDHVGSLNDLGHHGWTVNAQSVAQGHVGIYNATAKFGAFTEDDTAGNLSARDYKSSNHLIGAPPDPGGVRAADGLAGWLDDSELAATLNRGGNNGGFRTEPGEHLTQGGGVMDDPLLPLGLDSHRYRCCGNGVVSSVAEWVGLRLAAVMA